MYAILEIVSSKRYESENANRKAFDPSYGLLVELIQDWGDLLRVSFSVHWLKIT